MTARLASWCGNCFYTNFQTPGPDSTGKCRTGWRYKGDVKLARELPKSPFDHATLGGHLTSKIFDRIFSTELKA